MGGRGARSSQLKSITQKIDSLESEIENAKTSSQVLDILRKNDISFKRNEPMESDRVPKTKNLDVEMDEGFRRIYYSPYDKKFILQKRQRVDYIPNGKKRKILINDNTYTTIDDYETRVTSR